MKCGQPPPSGACAESNLPTCREEGYRVGMLLLLLLPLLSLSILLLCMFTKTS